MWLRFWNCSKTKHCKQHFKELYSSMLSVCIWMRLHLSSHPKWRGFNFSEESICTISKYLYADVLCLQLTMYKNFTGCFKFIIIRPVRSVFSRHTCLILAAYKTQSCTFLTAIQKKRKIIPLNISLHLTLSIQKKKIRDIIPWALTRGIIVWFKNLRKCWYNFSFREIFFFPRIKKTGSLTEKYHRETLEDILTSRGIIIVYMRLHCTWIALGPVTNYQSKLKQLWFI